jgi:membrane dipeptidase
MHAFTFASILTGFLFLHGQLAAQHMDDQALSEKANELAQKFIITDGHIDLPYRLTVQNFRLEKEYLGIPIETDKGDFDYIRAKKGGLDAPFMSIYIPAKYQNEKGASKILADELIAMVEGIVEAHPDKFGTGNNPNEIMRNFRKGLISLPMGMENGSPLETLEDISYFYQKGIRYVTLTHSKDNLISDSSYDTTGTWGGLSPYGKKVVKEMNKVGIMVDISHVSDNAFFQVMDITAAPVIASHSSCRKFTPGFERNMSDEMIKRLAENGGVIQINFGTSFLDGKLSKQRDKMRNKLRKLLADQNLESKDEAAKPIIEEFRKNNPALYADVERVADHIDHVVKIAGIDHVGIGSDFDGVGDSLPTGLKDVSQYPNLIKALLKRGYSDDDVAKVCYQNVFRVWQQVENIAAQSE